MPAQWPLIMQRPCDVLVGQLTPAAGLWSYASWWITRWSRCLQAAAEHFPHGELVSALFFFPSRGAVSRAAEMSRAHACVLPKLLSCVVCMRDHGCSILGSQHTNAALTALFAGYIGAR